MEIRNFKSFSSPMMIHRAAAGCLMVAMKHMRSTRAFHFAQDESSVMSFALAPPSDEEDDADSRSVHTGQSEPNMVRLGPKVARTNESQGKMPSKMASGDWVLRDVAISPKPLHGRGVRSLRPPSSATS